ncbi:MAG: chemotaxis-specific protein-glutamate methyltransferase CheB [Lachnospiraceae bacterium]|nr:chemotaxis-specific protein-glutamate methyltransferase CheB [Lachnospiraceae bacterium]
MKNILIIDDSALMRRVISDIINQVDELHTDTSASNGLEGLELLESGKKFDAIVLDINMPKMNGLEFLKVLNKKRQKEKVIIVSTIAKEGAKETIQALELGAFDFVTKPGSLSEAKGPAFGKRLTDILYAATGIEQTGRRIFPKREASAEGKVEQKKSFLKSSFFQSTSGRGTQLLKSDRSRHSRVIAGKGKRKLVALACSTGGPKALQYVIPFLPANLDAAVLLVQHMPVGFTASLSNRLNELSRIHVKEAEDGEVIQKGTVYIARGGSQMRLIEKNKQEHCLSVQQEEARNGLRPCADIMYESLRKSNFDDITCVIMTGMGADGTKGILELEQTNKIYVIAQDEASCTVYGMPKSIAEADAVDEVQELKNIADAITKHVGVQ